MDTSSYISLRPGSLWIEGRPRIVVASSLFYFRIPASGWRSRMRTLRALGYNAIDTYIPWNYHEVEPGTWDFGGERDVEAFLCQAKEEGLWVIARPGPYICSEWDGGALPAYLFAQPGVRVRDGSPAYLAAVENWFDRIMPMLARNQLDHGGAVILIQLENELDFYSCSDRPALMGALRDMALGHGITVPLVACAGQGDIPGATGNVGGIAPTCNVYFDPRDPMVEARVRHYDAILREQGYPLCIIETNRNHADLRRLLAGGAKLIGPYLQTGGTDFGFTTSVTNWGEPLSFMTSHYDFGGMISPGGRVRPDSQEAVILTKMIAALGPALALSRPLATPPITVTGGEGQTLALDGGGYLVGLPNVGETPSRVSLGEQGVQFPVHYPLITTPNTCPFVLLDWPLSQWGFADVCLAYATAELVDCRRDEGELVLAFAVDGAAEFLVEWPASEIGGHHGWQFEPTPMGWRLWTDGDLPANVELMGMDGKRLLMKALARAEVGDLRAVGLDESVIVASAPEAVGDVRVNWSSSWLDPCSGVWFDGATVCLPGRLHLEENGIYCGYGWYESLQTCPIGTEGLLILGGADVLSVYLDTFFLGTVTPKGGDLFIPLPGGACTAAVNRLLVRAEIWGHANFDDHRLPALRLNAMRGMGGMVAVRSVQNITPNWFYQHGVVVPNERDPGSLPFVYFGGWSSTDEPVRGVYYRDVTRANEMDVCVLHFPGLEAAAQVYVDGQLAGLINPFNPYLDLSGVAQPSARICIAVAVEQDFRRPVGQAVLYPGDAIRDWRVAGWKEDRLVRLAHATWRDGTMVGFPMRFAAGEMRWLCAELPMDVEWESGFNLQYVGQGVKVTAVIGEHLIGRVWLPSAMRPRMTGGADDRMLLPAHWLREAGGRVQFLLESVDSPAELLDIKIIRDR
ncbi:MAG: beta-galactosidase [Anaerolineales bacterium]|nr:beta-galactosidase [Anaerolineales bacterium]